MEAKWKKTAVGGWKKLGGMRLGGMRLGGMRAGRNEGWEE